MVRMLRLLVDVVVVVGVDISGLCTARLFSSLTCPYYLFIFIYYCYTPSVPVKSLRFSLTVYSNLTWGNRFYQ